jgi:hypothetical protein
MTSRRPLAALLAATALSVLAAAPALASTTQQSFIEDEHQMLQLGPDARSRALDDVQSLGADGIRVVVLWRSIAPSPDAAKRPKGFDAKNPAAYPAANWDALDDLVRGAQARGLQVLLSPSGPIPVWASTCRSRAGVNKRTCKPRASAYGAFVRALGTRYSGGYADENQGGGALPRVATWSFWNEPNQPGWLSPQYEFKGGRAVNTAARVYRDLARSGLAGLRATGHGSDVRLLGETAPIGSSVSSCLRGRSGSSRSRCLAKVKADPTTFIKGLLCLGTKTGLGCGGFKRLNVSGFAHHPYTRGGGVPPTTRATTPGEITIGTGARLHRLLDQGARARRIPSRLPIYYTESGFQTNPPDTIFGVRLDQQAAYLNESDYMAYRDSRVRSMSQYIIVDEVPQSSFQSGLRMADGSPKPSYAAWRLPLWVVKHGSGVRVWGQLRPLPDSAPSQVEVQRSADGSSFSTVQTVTVSSRKGFFAVTVPNQSGGTWKLRWTSPSGAVLESRAADVAPK